jgi:hypothetical protein
VWGLRSDPLLPLLLLAAAMLASAVVVGPVRELLGTVAVGPTTWLGALVAGAAAYTLTSLLRARSV